MVVLSLISLGEAKQILRVDGTDSDLLLSQIITAAEQYILNATGKDFSGDPLAKMAASMLVVMWFENPAMIGKVGDHDLSYGLNNIITQLQAVALPEVVT